LGSSGTYNNESSWAAVDQPIIETTQESVSVTTANQPLESGMSNLNLAPEITDFEQKELPTVVKETVVPTERIEVQPVVHRDFHETEVHEVLQPLKEREVAPTEVFHATLPAEVLPEVRKGEMPISAPLAQSESFVAPLTTERFEKTPVIEETVQKRIIEEVQPVLYKEVVKPVLVEQVRPVYEKVVEAPVFISEEKPMVDLGTKTLPTALPGQSLPSGGLAGTSLGAQNPINTL